MLHKSESLGCTSHVFLSRAQGLRSYEEYSQAIQTLDISDLDIDSIILFGPKKSVNKLTGNMKALR